MPPQIGAFISNAVYDDLLQSNPLHSVKDDVIACQFINANGDERPIKTSFAVSIDLDCIKNSLAYIKRPE
jgi:regulator of nonsense transcripts 1